MFDMLDDDLDMGYVPTALSNSRSGNMKKLTKKQPKAQPKQPSSKAINNKSNDFDDLLDDLIDFDHKKPSKPVENKSTAAPKNLFNSLESQPEEPKSTSLEKKNKETVGSNLSKPPMFKLDQADQIIHEDHGFNSFGRTAQNIPSVSKVEDSFVSSRNMKPPMRKKNDVTESVSFGVISGGLTMPEDTFAKNTVQKNEEDDVIRPPPRLMNRRSSADGKNQRIEESLSLPKNNRSESPINAFSFDNKREEPVKVKETLKLSLDEPKIEAKFSPKTKNQQVNSFKVKFADIEQKPYEKAPVKQIAKTQKIQPKQQKPKKGLDLHVDQSITILRDSPQPISSKVAVEQYQKQMQQLKITFQKQIDFLQDNLDRQIVVNRETRDKLMRQSNKMIEEERVRTKKVHEEELRRQKELFQWEKKRMEDSFQAEIQNLRQSLEYAQKSNGYSFKTTNSSRQDVQYLQNQLNHQKRLLADRERILQKRESDLSQRQSELNKRKRKQQERLRQQQKRIVEGEMKMKKQMLEQKRIISEQKQQMAVELANLQIQAMKKRERADYSLKENKIEKQGLQNQRFELRNQNAELMARYRAKMEQVQQEKQRVRLIEADLIKKLRIVEHRAKQTSQGSVNQTMYAKKENNWIQDRDTSQQNLRSYSIERREAVNKTVNAHQTKDRFYQLQSNTKSKMNISAKQNKKFDLDNYMMTVEEYKKLRGEP